MKFHKLIAAGCLAAFSIQAEIIPIDISPAGTSNAEGLSPLNEVPPVDGTGSGDEIFTGITYDTDTKTLEVAIGYGSFAGFTDLTGPIEMAHIHGPAAVDENAGVVFDFGGAGQHLFAPNPATGGVIIGGAIILTDEQETDLLNGLYYVNLHTVANPGGELRGQLIPMVNRAPEITCPEPVEAECEPPDGSTVTLVASVSDPDGDALVVTWSIAGEVVHTEEVPAGDDVTEAEVEYEGQYGLGVHEVEVSVSDGTGEPVSCTTTVTIVDTTAPEIVRIATDPRYLWPPNHKMVPVRVRLRALDCSEVSSKIVRVTSNERVNGKGDGNTAPDWEITGDMRLMLRAERAGGGNGRIYTVYVETTDAGGLSTMSEVKVRVPHDQSGMRYDREHEEDRKEEIETPDRPDNRGRRLLPGS